MTEEWKGPRTCAHVSHDWGSTKGLPYHRDHNVILHSIPSLQEVSASTMDRHIYFFSWNPDVICPSI